MNRSENMCICEQRPARVEFKWSLRFGPVKRIIVKAILLFLICTFSTDSLVVDWLDGGLLELTM